MTNLEALKELYISTGGNPKDVADLKLLADVIAKLKGVAGARVKLGVALSGGSSYITYNGKDITQKDLYKLIKGKTPTINGVMPAVIEESDELITVRYIVVGYVWNRMTVTQFSARADSNERVEYQSLKTYSLTEEK